MVEDNKKIYLLRDEKIPVALIKLGIPAMIGMMVSAFYNIVDSYFVGKLGTSQMAAVSIVYPLSLIILAVGLLFGCGAGNHISRLLGNKEYEKASEYASTAIFTSMIVGGIIVSLMLIFINPLLKAIGATDSIMVYAKEYGVLFIIGLFINVFNSTFTNIMTSEGASLYSMVSMVLGSISNLVLDPLLIITFGFGVKGAAMATLVSRIISLAINLSYIFFSNSVLKISLSKFKPYKEIYLEIFKLGMPMLAYQFLTSFSLSLTNLFASDYGDNAVAGLGVVSRVMSLATMTVFGFLRGYQPIVAYNYGAKRMDRVKKVTHISLLWTTIFSIIVAAICIVFSKDIIYLFTKNDINVVDVGSKALIVNAILFIFMGFQGVYSYMFLGLGMAKEGGLICMGRQGIFFIPVIIIFSFVFHLNGIIMAQPVADALSVCLVFILINKHKSSLKLQNRVDMQKY